MGVTLSVLKVGSKNKKVLAEREWWEGVKEDGVVGGVVNVYVLKPRCTNIDWCSFVHSFDKMNVT